ncbi:hypothetical protein D1872_325420 [compost metagenome]
MIIPEFREGLPAYPVLRLHDRAVWTDGYVFVVFPLCQRIGRVGAKGRVQRPAFAHRNGRLLQRNRVEFRVGP